MTATEDERAAVFALIGDVKRQLDEELAPDAYNVGFNAGAAAGQTQRGCVRADQSLRRRRRRWFALRHDAPLHLDGGHAALANGVLGMMIGFLGN